MRKNYVKQIAKERIAILFNLAEIEFLKHPERSNRYVEIARKIAMKANVSIPEKYKQFFCKNCGSYLFPGISSTKRLKKGFMEIKCEKCSNLKKLKY